MFCYISVVCLQLMYVANFGKQEKYFFMRMGRSAPTGSGEIWAMAESGEVATDMHNKLNKIVERESEKKRQLGVGPLVHPRTASSSRHHPGSSGSSHRERSNTQPQRQRTSSIDNIDEPLMGAPSPLTKFLETCE
uniref:IRS-type PTB domain-containing protein n=1 Tax=Plectus sambesii TaxID=2011161 RepID=A0A914UT38_9BILA